MGLSAPDIAEVFGMSVSAVKVAQWRAFKRLRDLLDGEEKDAGSTETTDDLLSYQGHGKPFLL